MDNKIKHVTMIKRIKSAIIFFTLYNNFFNYFLHKNIKERELHIKVKFLNLF